MKPPAKVVSVVHVDPIPLSLRTPVKLNGADAVSGVILLLLLVFWLFH
jgi:hypothetical protein